MPGALLEAAPVLPDSQALPLPSTTTFANDTPRVCARRPDATGHPRAGRATTVGPGRWI